LGRIRRQAFREEGVFENVALNPGVLEAVDEAFDVDDWAGVASPSRSPDWYGAVRGTGEPRAAQAVSNGGS
jgi:hypothetical protein